MENKKEKIERIVIPMSGEKQLELWDGLYHKGTSYEMDGETYTNIERINTSDYSDGDSWDYIVQRKSDGLFFKFNVWDAGDRNGYLCQDKGLEQVFETVVITYK
jgi:hypothetical protein